MARAARTSAVLALVGAAALDLGALSAGARGGPSSGGGRLGAPSGQSKTGRCVGLGRSGVYGVGRTSKHVRQPFLEYDGTISTPADQKYPATYSWALMLDRCGATPKLAGMAGEFPGYYCGNTEWYDIATSWSFYTRPPEPSLGGGTLTITGARPMGEASAVAYDISGKLSGQVRVPKRGPAKGSSQISGTVTPEACPGEAFPFTVKFTRSWGELIRNGGV